MDCGAPSASHGESPISEGTGAHEHGCRGRISVVHADGSARRRVAQPRRGLADVPVLGRGRLRQRLALRALRHARGRRRRDRVRRGHRRRAATAASPTAAPASGTTSRSPALERIADFMQGAGRGAGDPARPRRAQGVDASARGRAASRSAPPRPSAARGLAAWSAPSALARSPAATCRPRSLTARRSGGDRGRVRRADAPRARRRLRHRRDPRRARLPAARVPLAASATGAPTPMAARSRTACASRSRSPRPCAEPGRTTSRCSIRISAIDGAEGGWSLERHAALRARAAARSAST